MLSAVGTLLHDELTPLTSCLYLMKRLKICYLTSRIGFISLIHLPWHFQLDTQIADSYLLFLLESCRFAWIDLGRCDDDHQRH